MTREKILDYLNLEGINKGQKFQKSTVIWLLWFGDRRKFCVIDKV